MELVSEAIAFAVQAHDGMRRKKGDVPYILHPLEAAVIVGTMTSDQHLIAAAVLHDVVEDTDYTLEDLSKMGYPSEVIDVLRLLTHDPEVPYFDYVKAISVNPIAKQVKLADLAHNSDLSRMDESEIDDRAIARTEKYKKAIDILNGLK